MTEKALDERVAELEERVDRWFVTVQGVRSTMSGLVEELDLRVKALEHAVEIRPGLAAEIRAKVVELEGRIDAGQERTRDFIEKLEDAAELAEDFEAFQLKVRRLFEAFRLQLADFDDDEGASPRTT